MGNLFEILKIYGPIIAARYIFTKILLLLPNYNKKLLKRRIIFIKIDGLPYPTAMRLGTTDHNNFKQIFKDHEYGKLKEIKYPKTIVDLGGYIGLASLWFLREFPEAKLVTVEADYDNFSMLKMNLRMYKDRVKIINKGIWSKETKLKLIKGVFRDGADWANQVREAGANEKPDLMSTDIPSILETTENGIIDILKIDIEKAEIELFSQNSRKWLPNIRNIAIELHGPDSEKAFFAALRNYNFDKYISGELTLILNLKPKI